MDQNKYYKTSSFYLSAFLSAKGFILNGIEKDSFKARFVFVNSNKLQRLIGIFSFGKNDHPDLMVNFKEVEQAIKKLKSLIYDKQ